MLWPLLFTAALTSLLVAASSAAWFFILYRRRDFERRRLLDENEQVRTQVETQTAENRRLAEDVAARRQENAVLQERQAGFDKRTADLREQFEAAQKQAREQFQSLAADVLEQSNKRFLELANENFAGKQKEAAASLEQRKRAIEQMVKPMRETLDKHASAVGELEKNREGAYRGLRQQVASLVEDQHRLRDQTQKLAGALRRSDVRGRWGEVQLRRIAELAGMIPHCDFEEQVTVQTKAGDGEGAGGGGVRKPDMVVRLPAGRNIVVDSKAPMAGFLDALECEDEAGRADCLERHVGHIQQKVRDLSSKRYQDQFERSPDFVVLFIPGESFLQAAVRQSPDLIERAMNAGVVIASPITLMSLLKVVALGWREERVADNAQRISDLGVELHERIATATDHIEKLGKHLETAMKAYNSFVGSYESRVLSSARKFSELSADSPKELPAEGELKRVESMPRTVRGEG